MPRHGAASGVTLIRVREAWARGRYLLHRACTSRLGLRLLYPFLKPFCRRARPFTFLSLLYPWLHPPAAPACMPRPPGSRHILVLRPDHIGDLLYSLPALLRLSDGLKPGDRLTLLVDPCNAELAQTLLSNLDVVVFRIFGPSGAKLLPSGSEFQRLREMLGVIDVAVDMRPDGHSGLILSRLVPTHTYRISNRGNDIEHKVGRDGIPRLYPAARDPNTWWFFSLTMQGARPRLMFEFADAVARALGADSACCLEQGLMRSSELLRARFRRIDEGAIVFCPEARNRVKVWAARDWRKLVDTLLREGLRVQLLGQRRWPRSPVSTRCDDRRGTTNLLEALAHIARARVFIGFDSGPAHFACLIGVPTVTIFNGTTDPGVWTGIPFAGPAWIATPLGSAEGASSVEPCATALTEVPELQQVLTLLMSQGPALEIVYPRH